MGRWARQKHYMERGQAMGGWSQGSRRWLEEPLQGCYLSYAVVPPSSGLIHERLESDMLKGKNLLEEFVDQFKKLNPDLDSVFIRLDHEE